MSALQQAPISHSIQRLYYALEHVPVSHLIQTYNAISARDGLSNRKAAIKLTWILKLKYNLYAVVQLAKIDIKKSVAIQKV